MENNIFYIYIYLDPRKPGLYNYRNYTFDFEPFYVGKGYGKRNITHLKEALNLNIDVGRNDHKFSKIRKILRDGFEPIILKVEENLLEQDALNLEIWLIWSIGRNDKLTGPLTNHSNGGEGTFGWNHTEIEKQKISSRMLGEKNHFFGKTHSHETKLIMSQKAKARRASPETKQKMSVGRKGEKSPMWGTNLPKEVREKISKKHQGKVVLQKTKDKMRESQKRRWKLKKETFLGIKEFQEQK